MQLLSTREEMQAADRQAISLGTPGLELMERAAAAVALRLSLHTKPEDEIVFICGTGSNGGDGLAAARLLACRGWQRIAVYMQGDPETLKGDARTNRDRLRETGLEIRPAEQWQPGPEAWVVDALFGTGLNRELRPEAVELIGRMNRTAGKILAVDLPSGADANTGRSWGALVRAEETVTFARKKQGLLLEPARSSSGFVVVAQIGLPVEQKETSRVFSLDREDLAERLPRRLVESNKGTYGRLLALVGSEEMTGAAVLSCRAAYKSGVGLVEAVMPAEGSLPLRCAVPEAILSLYRQKDDCEIRNLERASALLIGPGLGLDFHVLNRIRFALEHFPAEKPVVLDADGLNWLARSPELAELVRRRGGRTILTPHLLEASRLMQNTVEEIRQDRIRAARELAAAYNACVILKDAVTVTASPEGCVCVNPTGNHGMATAGSGDVLAGLTAGLAAQGTPAFDAACLGAWIHGEAGDRAVQETGYYGLTASDIGRFIHIERAAGI